MTTPARNTRSRANSQQPLPVTASRANNAYGSRGSASLEEQGSGMGASLGGGVMQGRRHGASASGRQSREASVANSSGGSPDRAVRKRNAGSRQSAIEEESEEEDDFSPPQLVEVGDARPASNIGTAVEAEAPYERRGERRSAAVAAGSGEHLGEVSQPWALSVLLLSVGRYLKVILEAVSRFCLSLPGLLLFLVLLFSAGITFFAVEQLPEPWDDRRLRFVRGARYAVGGSYYELPPSGLEKHWLRFSEQRRLLPEELPEANMPEIQWAININMVSRLDREEKAVAALSTELVDFKSFISGVLPRVVVVDVEDGHLKIGDDFYTALVEKMLGDDSFWDTFLANNQQALASLSSVSFDGKLDAAQQTKEIISAATALELIRIELQRMEEAYTKKIRGIAQEAVQEAMATSSADRLPETELAKHFYIENTLLELQNINFFSTKSGAKPIRSLSSPSAYNKQSSKLAMVWAWLFYPPNPCITALQSWSEFRDAWCASESNDKGKAQLGIKTQFGIAPTELIIEHIPASGSMAITTAPRNIELWMEMETVEEAQQIQEEIASRSLRYEAIGGCLKSPGEKFVCVSKGEYDIHKPNWVQKFPTFIDMVDRDHRSKTFAVKVHENWGGDSTCLYRVRLHGHTSDGRAVDGTNTAASQN